jgi:Domain of unknown function (DUF1772)
MSFGLLATFCAGTFTGAAAYINAVEHPARISCGVPAALAEWRPSYKRATWMQAPLAIVGALSAVGAAVTESRKEWLLVAAALGSVVPLTLLAIHPTNERLLDPTIEDDLPRAEAQLERWNRLHALRTLAGGTAFISALRLRGSR